MTSAHRDSRCRTPEVPRPSAVRPPARASSDPFFDRPYEPTAPTDDVRPAWDQKSAAAQPIQGRTPNIRAKRKVASLLGGNS